MSKNTYATLSGMCRVIGLDASFLLAIFEVSLLTVRLFHYGGGPVSQKDQTQFPDGGNRS